MNPTRKTLTALTLLLLLLSLSEGWGAAPTITNPSEGEVVTPCFRIRWTAVSGTLRYRVHIAEIGGSDISGGQPLVSATLWDVPADLLQQNHQYRVRVENDATHELSTWVRFWVMSTKATLVAPLNDTLVRIDQVVLRWNEVNSAYGYEWLVTDAAGNAVAQSAPNPPAVTSVQVSGLARDRRYFWKVRARTCAKDDPYSDTGSFITYACDPIVVTGQSGGGQNVKVGSTVNMSIAVTGPTPSYQWRFNGGDIPGATGPTLTLGNLQTSQSGPYACVVWNECTAQRVVDFGTLTVFQPPANDDFANRIEVFGSSVTVQGPTVNASREIGEPSSYGPTVGGTVWWKWRAPFSGVVTIQHFAPDPFVAVYTGTAIGGLTIAPSSVSFSNQFPPSYLREERFYATQGVEYQIQVGLGNQAPGTVRLSLLLQPPPANDLFAGRTVLTGTQTSVSGTTRGANCNLEPGEPNHRPNSFSSQSLWWSWTAPASGEVQISVDRPSPGHIAVYEGSSVSSLTLVDQFSGDTAFSLTAFLSFFVVSGHTYQIAVANEELPSLCTPALGDYYSFSLKFAPHPQNDSFANRVTIPSNANRVMGTTVAASREAGEPAHAGQSSFRSIWWTWTPDRNGPIIMTAVGSNVNTRLAVYTNTNLSQLGAVVSNDNFGPDGDPSARVVFNAVAGVSYQIAVDVSGLMVGPIELHVRRMGIQSIAVAENPLPDQETLFAGTIRVLCPGDIDPAPLRVTLWARAGYSFTESKGWQTSLVQGEQFLGTFAVPSVEGIGNSRAYVFPISGTCPAPVRVDWGCPNGVPNGTACFGYGWGVVAQVEQQLGTNWYAQDSAVALFGEWPEVGGFSGPGGGVIRIDPPSKNIGGDPFSVTNFTLVAPTEVSEGSHAVIAALVTFGDGVRGWTTNCAWGSDRFTIEPNVVSNVVLRTGPVEQDSVVKVWSAFLFGQNPPRYATNQVVVVNSPLSVFGLQKVLRSSGGELSFSWVTRPGKTYALQFKTNLNDAVWTTFLRTNAATPEVTFKRNPNSPSNGFYRVLLE